jgi:hypothetical protein
MRRASALVAVLLLVLCASGCDEKLRDVAGPTPDLQPTFSSIQRDILGAPDASGRAACTGCHTNQGRNPSAGMNLFGAAAYDQLVNRASNGKPGAIRVIPGDPDNSYFVQKLEGAPGIVGERMPRTGGPYLTPGQILVIRRWIQLGARND